MVEIFSKVDRQRDALLVSDYLLFLCRYIGVDGGST